MTRAHSDIESEIWNASGWLPVLLIKKIPPIYSVLSLNYSIWNVPYLQSVQCLALLGHVTSIGMSCPSWQWHRTGSRWSPVRTLPVAPLWCDLEFVPNSRGNKSCGEPSPYWHISLTLVLLSQQAWYCLPLAKKESFAGRGLKMIIFICCSKIDCWQ